jgi:multiple sugar transport system permease protein
MAAAHGERAASAAAVRHGRPRRRRFGREALAGYLFVAPSALHFLVFVFGLAIASSVISLFEWDLISDAHFVGLRNYRELLQDDVFWLSLRNTVYYSIIYIPLSLSLGLGLALAVNAGLRGAVAFRVLYFLPYIAPMVAVAILFRWLYNPEFGLINWALGWLWPGDVTIDWLGNPALSLPAIAFMTAWKNLGWTVTLFLAGLLAIPRHLYEAAAIDGAGRWAQFRHVTWPLLTPITFFLTVTTVLGSFQVFDAVYLMTQGGPGRSTYVYNFYLYQQGFRFFNMGYAAAMAWIMVVILAVITYLQFRFLNRRVNYELG